MNQNYTYLYNNLNPEVKKFTNIYRSLSPVVIKTFGGNNFVYERKYQAKINNDIYDSEYDYIENELKKSKGIKAHTAYTELSTQENMSLFGSQMQKPTKRYYQNRTNINTGYDNYFPSGNDNSLLKERNNNKTRTYISDKGKYRYKILKKDEMDEIIFPNEKLRNSNYENFKNNNKKIELISQSFSTSIIPEKKIINNNKRNKIFEIKYIKDKKSFPYKEKELKILNNNLNSIKRDSSYSRLKFNLDEFNIDKLKEIGDNYAIRLSQNQNMLHQNNNEIIKKMIIIKEKRRLPNKKTNLLLKSMDNIKNKIKKNLRMKINIEQKLQIELIKKIFNLNIMKKTKK